MRTGQQTWSKKLFLASASESITKQDSAQGADALPPANWLLPGNRHARSSSAEVARIAVVGERDLGRRDSEGLTTISPIRIRSGIPISCPPNTPLIHLERPRQSPHQQSLWADHRFVVASYAGRHKSHPVPPSETIDGAANSDRSALKDTRFRTAPSPGNLGLILGPTICRHDGRILPTSHRRRRRRSPAIPRHHEAGSIAQAPTSPH
jgi:hypothetical protein